MSLGQHQSTTGVRDQAGIAIVSVLMVVSVILMLGVGSLVLTQSNLMTAENLVANSIAKGNADAGIDATVSWLFARYQADGRLPATLGSVPTVSLPAGALDFRLADGGYVLLGDDRVALRVVGSGPRDSEFVAEALVSFTQGGVVDGGSPFHGAVVGCDGVRLAGSGRIDSFDSRVALYDPNAFGRHGDVLTVTPGAQVSITGASPIAGDVNSTGGLYTSGSARVMGNINASGYVDISASAHYEGDIRTTGDINLRNTATIYGSVSSNGNIAFNNGATVGGNALAGGNIAFNNSGARVSGDARAGGLFTRGHGNSSTVHVAGSATDNGGAVNNLAVPSEDCDPIGIVDVMSEFSHLQSSGNLSTGYPFNSWQLTPSAISHYDETWNVQQWTEDTTRVAHQVEVFGRETTMYKVGNLNLGNGELRVTGGHVTIFVTGDLTLGTGGGKGLTIDEGSSLTVFVVGKTKIGSSVKMSNRRPVNADGVPTFSLFSSYVNSSEGSLWDTQAAGVVVEGDSQLTASVYAPLAKVSVTAGGNLLGALRGRWVDVPGGAGMHFDEALADADLGGSSGSSDGEASVAILSRR